MSRLQEEMLQWLLMQTSSVAHANMECWYVWFWHAGNHFYLSLVVVFILNTLAHNFLRLSDSSEFQVMPRLYQDEDQSELMMHRLAWNAVVNLKLNTDYYDCRSMHFRRAFGQRVRGEWERFWFPHPPWRWRTTDFSQSLHLWFVCTSHSVAKSYDRRLMNCPRGQVP